MEKILQNFFNVLLSFVIILGVASCRDEDDDVVHNPFIGVWKDNYSKIEYKKDGTWIEYINYYSTVHDAYRYTETGTYSCDKYLITLSKTYDKSGRSYTYMIQTANNGRIVYYDPTDMYTWTLEYKGKGKDNQTNPASLRFDSNGGSGWMSSIDAWTGVVIGLPINEFTRNGYEFIGWNTKADGSGESFGYSTSMITAMFTISKNTTLYAQWESISGSSSALGKHNGYEYVDLGLSVKWATCNVGADFPEDYGDYFAWGETSPKSDYDWDTYKLRTSGDSWYNVKFSKYNTDSDYGPIDNKTTLDLSDDVARANWGGSWRMPTYDELYELKTKCTWTWYTLNGVKGCKVTGPNGNSIFLPAAGDRLGTSVSGAGSNGRYWSSSLDSSDPSRAYYLYFYSGNVDWRSYARYYGPSVRAVCSETENIPTSYTISFNANGGEGEMSLFEIWSGETPTLPICTFTRDGYEFIGWNTKADGSGASYGNEQSITVAENLVLYAQWKEIPKITHNGYEYVDLGLSVKWATCNVGASSPEGYGSYFAWGETSPKSDYEWETYKYSRGSNDELTKYCDDSDYGYNGYTDNKTTLDLIDDAARVNWGGSWRMPTRAEQDELREKCTWTWTTLNGVRGYKVTSKSNGNSIFLPAAVYRSGTYVYGAGSSGLYWSSSLSSSYPYVAYYLYFDSGDVGRYGSYRYYGFTVRAVCP